MSAEAERIQAMLDLYRRYEHTELRDWALEQLQAVVMAVRCEQARKKAT